MKKILISFFALCLLFGSIAIYNYLNDKKTATKPIPPIHKNLDATKRQKVGQIQFQMMYDRDTSPSTSRNYIQARM